MNSVHILLLALGIWVLVCFLSDLTDKKKKKSVIDKLRENNDDLISRFK